MCCTSPSTCITFAPLMCSCAQAFRCGGRGDVVLWPADLPPASLVALGGRDGLLPAELIITQLHQAKNPAEVGRPRGRLQLSI